MTIFTEKESPRLRYIARFISGELESGDPVITTDRNFFLQAKGILINYSQQPVRDQECRIHPQGLLSQTGIQSQAISCSVRNGIVRFFTTGGDTGFDIFSAAFYLLSRYEEYLPYDDDSYGRFPHTASLAFTEGFLDRPLVNEWIGELRTVLLRQGQTVPVPERRFRFLPTYDIDMAYSYLGKGWWRNTSGWIRSIWQADWSQASERISVLRGKQKDPYDSFDWMNALHNRYALDPLYFFLIPRNRGAYDKNIDPDHPLMKQLITACAEKYETAIHPSWRSGDEKYLLGEEIGRLRKITGRPVLQSRFHYVRFKLPVDYRRLLAEGIRHDHSMGYGSINGFRASVTTPYYWYDLEKEEESALMVHPFCFMEANSFYEQGYTAGQTAQEMREYCRKVKAVQGCFISLWHNHFFGTDPAFRGLKEVYKEFVRENII